MIAFRVSVNGKVVATAGIPGSHVLTAIVNSVAGSTPKRDVDRLWMHLGGIASRQRGRKERQLNWLQGEEELKVGDRVLIEIVDVDSVDEPIANQAVKAPPRPPKRQAGGARLRVAR